MDIKNRITEAAKLLENNYKNQGIYANTTILGGETIVGKNSVVAGNTFVTESIPENTKVSAYVPELMMRKRENK